MVSDENILNFQMKRKLNNHKPRNSYVHFVLLVLRKRLKWEKMDIENRGHDHNTSHRPLIHVMLLNFY